MNQEPPMNDEPVPPDQPTQPAVPAEEHEAEPPVQPRIWVASLADYNNGSLHGAWLDAARDEPELQADVDSMLAASPLTAATGEPVEEWVIFDYDGFGRLRIDEHENLHWISLVAKGIHEHGLAFAAYADVVEEEELLAGFNDDYLGHYDSLQAYVEQAVNDLGSEDALDAAVPPSLRPYVKIDLSATANDLLRGGDLLVIPAAGGGVWIFRG